MTDEVKEEGKQEEQSPATPEYSEVEKQAMVMGWKPKDEYNGDEDRWVDAGEFVRRDPLIKKIETYGRKVRDLETTLHDFAEHHKKVREDEYNRAVRDLKSKYKEALRDHDTETALEFSEKLEELEESHRKAPPVPEINTKTGTSEAFDSWVDNNTWYTTDSEMHDFADEIAIGYVNRRGGPDKVDEQMMFRHVENVIKRQFPEKFENPNRKRPPSTSKGSSNSGSVGGTKGFTLTPEQEAVARKFAAKGVMTYDKYVDELKKMESK